ncbi:MAG: hypothetical protein E7638_07295 [Ruminococcaceae bacterium]|nr:hypothetical protein [Oscillospiraceae bacterium]
MKKRTKICLVTVKLIILAVLFSPYIRAEYLTFVYGKQFAGLEQQTNILNPARYFRVLAYSETEATVFYVSDTGDLMTFVKDANGEWERAEWKTIWSTTGSADEFMWPYYR